MAMNGNNKIATEKQKLIQDKCLAILTTMLKDDDNKYCVDCDAKGPRWASWNLGVFLCIRCAGIHRNLGVHISKVKSVNLDTWKPEQAVSLQQMGNSRARAVYEANLPDNFRRPQTDSSLESFIRAKYEHNKYTAREWVPPRLPKVNWDSEIEAAMKEHRSSRKTGRGRVEMPAPVLSKPLPGPGSVSLPPASAAQSRVKAKPTEPPPPVTAPAPAAAAPPSSAAADLLGLDTPSAGSNSADPFGEFLAAAPVSEAPASAAAPAGSAGNLASDEANFFSQPAPAAAAAAAGGSVLSRDSIMALYGAGGGAGGGGGGFPSMPAASGPAAGFGAIPAASGGFPSMPAASGPAAGFGGIPAASGGFPSMPVASAAGGFPQAVSAGGGFPQAVSAVGGFPQAVSAVGGFPQQQQQQQPASYPAAQGFSMGFPAAQQQQQPQQFASQQPAQQQFAGLQQFQQVGAFQSAPYQQQQQYMAGAAFGQSFPGAQQTGAAAQQGFPPQLHQQMSGLSMGHPPMAAPAGFPPMGGAPAMGSTLGGQLWQ